MTIAISIIIIIATCLVIWRASDSFEVASHFLGRNLSEGVRGATINAIGSSLPELFTTLFFLFVLEDKDGFAGGIGTTAGSAIFNSAIIPAAVIFVVVIVGMAKRIKVSRRVIWRDGVTLLLAEVLLILVIVGNKLYWWHGLILILFYIGYMTTMLLAMKRKGKTDEGEDDIEDYSFEREGLLKSLLTMNIAGVFIRGGKVNTSNSIVVLIFSVLTIGAASFFLVDACEMLGTALDLPVYFIAVVLAAAATSVPDTVISIKDARSGDYDDALSNALGSNIFDICFALGLPIFLYGITRGSIEISGEASTNITELRIILLVFTGVVMLILAATKKLSIVNAILLLVIYALFLVYLLGKIYNFPFVTALSEQLTLIQGNINAYNPLSP